MPRQPAAAELGKADRLAEGGSCVLQHFPCLQQPHARSANNTTVWCTCKQAVKLPDLPVARFPPFAAMQQQSSACGFRQGSPAFCSVLTTCSSAVHVQLCPSGVQTPPSSGAVHCQISTAHISQCSTDLLPGIQCSGTASGRPVWQVVGCLPAAPAQHASYTPVLGRACSSCSGGQALSTPPGC